VASLEAQSAGASRRGDWPSEEPQASQDPHPGAAVPAPQHQQYVITGLGGFETGANAASSTAVETVPAPMFADIVLRETVVQAASLAAGLRRALSPEVRNRIRFEMRREVKRSRKQRRRDVRAAQQHLRTHPVDLAEDAA